jgi:hypothetical protein
MIANLCEFCQFSANQIGVFLKNRCYDQLVSKFSFVLSQKRQFFGENFSAKIFRRKYIKNHNIGPTCRGGVVYIVLTSLPATKEIGAMGREIESRQTFNLIILDNRWII